MAAGTQIRGTGNPIFYAGSAITNGLTGGLLSVFTDVSGATPSGNGRMYPGVTTIITQPEPNYRVNAGTYLGSYYINRNDSVGESFYSNFASTGGQFDIDLLHSYIHWTTDQRLSIDLQNISNAFYGFRLLISGTPVVDLASISPAPYGQGLDYYANFPGSGGAYSPASINTGWTFTISVAYDPANPPFTPGDLTFAVDVYDHHTNDLISSNSLQVSEVGGRNPPVQNADVYIDYWRCARVIVMITP